MRDAPDEAASPLFRPEALVASRSRLGAPVKSVSLASWVIAGFMFARLFAVAVFLSTANYARKETVMGSLEPATGAVRLASVRPGVTVRAHVAEGDWVAPGTPIFTITVDQMIEGGAGLGQVLKSTAAAQASALVEQRAATRAGQAQRLAELAARQRGLEARQDRLGHDLELQRARLRLSRDTLESFRKIYEQKFLSEVKFRAQEAAVISDEQGVSAIQREIEEVSANLAALNAERRRLGAEGAQMEAQLSSSSAALEEKRASASAETEAVIVAPVAGRVVAFTTRPGSPVTAGATLATILPRGATLQAELWAPSRAAGFVRPGDAVRLMYDAFPFERFGAGSGRVVSVGRVPIAPADLPIPIETKEGLYRIRVALDAQSVTAYGRAWPLSPGSRLRADLILESRSFLDWLLDPVRAAARRSAVA